mgnify:CR=1 FL=1
MKELPPRIQTLRGDGKTPKTSDCFTPRTMDGIDGAFKSVRYGSTIEGPYRSANVWTNRIMLIVAVFLFVAAIVLVAVQT